MGASNRPPSKEFSKSWLYHVWLLIAPIPQVGAGRTSSMGPLATDQSLVARKEGADGLGSDSASAPVVGGRTRRAFEKRDDEMRRVDINAAHGSSKPASLGQERVDLRRKSDRIHPCSGVMRAR